MYSNFYLFYQYHPLIYSISMSRSCLGNFSGLDLESNSKLDFSLLTYFRLYAAFRTFDAFGETCFYPRHRIMLVSITNQSSMPQSVSGFYVFARKANRV